MAGRQIVIPYKPREAFKGFHDRPQRWAVLVCHRRAGKTVAAVNDLIRAAVTCKTQNPLFGYVAPFRSQAKDIAWGFLKYYSRDISTDINESELRIDLLNGARIRLFGADNADAMRGLGFDGIFQDEYGDFKPSVWGSVIRPALSDKQGWAVFAGTPKGKNQFWDVFDQAQSQPEEWFSLRLPSSVSGIIPPEEIAALKRQTTPDQFLQEYECSFEAAILGAYYGTEMRELADAGRIREVKYDPSLQTCTAWDIGHTDDTSVWWYQVISGEIHVIDFYSVSGSSPEDMAKIILSKPYHYSKHYLPHDAKAKTFASGGKSTLEQLASLLGGIGVLGLVPDLSVQDGIQAARMTLPHCWFDAEKCKEGIEALRQYEREWDEDKKSFRLTPKHNWCFTGETEVLTRDGTQQIMNLPFTGEVLTSCGWKRYINPRVTRKNAPLVEVAFKDGLSVKCTPDHTFKTASGWISAESLTPYTPIQSVLTPLRSISTGISIGFGHSSNILRKGARFCTEMLGGRLLAPFLMGATSIIAMPSGQTIDFQTLSAFRRKSTSEKLSLINLSALSMLVHEPPLPLGTLLKRDGFGTSDMQNGQKDGKNGNAKSATVQSAKNNSIASFVNQAIARFIALLTAKRPHGVFVTGVKKLSETADVWCLTVPGAEEFALSNGALVHNCSHPSDAFRYLSIVWREEPQERRITHPERPFIVGPSNTVTLEDMWAAQKQRRKYARI